jgi:hypothetical protein
MPEYPPAEAARGDAGASMEVGGGGKAGNALADPGGGGEARPQKACCAGTNDCKGKGNCKTRKHACKARNDCKGQGGCRPLACP